MPNFVHYLYFIPLTISAVISFRAIKEQWPKPYRYFSGFLIATLGNELLAVSWKFFLHHTRYWDYSKSNLWIYNIYLTPQYLFYFLFFAAAINSPFLKRLKIPVCLGYAIFGVVNLLAIQSFKELNSFTIIAGNILVICCTIFYFVQELNQSEPIAVQRYPLFWISLGGFVFNTVSLPYFIFINYLSRNNLSLAIALFNILLTLNIIMYTCYLIAFLCKTPYLRKQP